MGILNLCPLNLDPWCLCVFTCLSLNSVQNGATALYIAAQNGHLRIVALLIAAKALIDLVHTAVSIACILVSWH